MEDMKPRTYSTITTSIIATIASAIVLVMLSIITTSIIATIASAIVLVMLSMMAVHPHLDPTAFKLTILLIAAVVCNAAFSAMCGVDAWRELRSLKPRLESE